MKPFFCALFPALLALPPAHGTREAEAGGTKAGREAALLEKMIADDTACLKRARPDAWLESYGRFLNRAAFREGVYHSDAVRVAGRAEKLPPERIAKTDAAIAWRVLNPALYDTAAVMKILRGAAENCVLRWRYSILGELSVRKRSKIHPAAYSAMYSPNSFNEEAFDTVIALASFPARGKPTVWISQAPDYMGLSAARKYWRLKSPSQPPPF